MNRIEGPLVKKDSENSIAKRNLREAASSLIKTEVYDPSNTALYTKEHLGKVVIEQQSHEPKTNPEKNRLSGLSENKIDTMPRAELIKLSATIEVDGSNLRQIYETKLLGENGLRRLIKEYLRGGDLKKILRQEILEREMDFERDPIMRDIKPLSNYAAVEKPAVTSSPTTINTLLKKAEESIAGSSEEAAFYRAKADFELKQMAKQNQRSRKIDYIMAGIISLLFISIIIMFFTRG